MTSRRRRTARAADRAAASMRVNGSAPALVRPVFLGVDASDWTDLPPAQYPEDTVEFIRRALAAGDQRRTLDAFRCDTCHGVTITVDRHPGYHPRLVDCARFDPERSRCPGLTTAAGYPDDLPSDVEPSHEWHRPSEDELLSLPDAFVDHVLRGGTLLRVIPAR